MTAAPDGRPVRRRTRLVLWPLAAVALGTLLGAVVVALTVIVVRAGSQPGEGFADLGIIVLGVLVGAVLGVTAAVLALVWVARRLFGRGRRLWPVLWSLAGVLALAVALSVVSGMLADAGVESEGLAVTGLVVLLVPSAAFLAWDRRG